MLKRIKIFLIIFIIGFSFLGHSQDLQKGKMKISLSGIPVYDWNHGFYGYGIKPGFEYFITEHFSIQNDFFYHTQSGLDIDGIQSRSSTIGFLPSVRYNHSLNNTKWLIFGQIGMGFGAVLYKPTDDNNTSSSVNWLDSGVVLYSAGIGVDYHISNRFDIEFALPYIFVDNITNVRNSSILFRGIGPTIGIKFSLNNKK